MGIKDGDFGFVGPEDTTADVYQDRQKLLNWFVELSVDENAKVPKALLGAPGLIQVASVAPIPAPKTWTWDSSVITFDSSHFTFDGSVS